MKSGDLKKNTPGYDLQKVNNIDMETIREERIGHVLELATRLLKPWYRIADGSTYPRYKTDGETMTEFFKIFGVTFGTGDNSTTCNLPNITRTVPNGISLVIQTCTTGLDIEGNRVGVMTDDVEAIGELGYSQAYIDSVIVSINESQNTIIHQSKLPPRTLSASTTSFTKGEAIKDANYLNWYAKTDFTKDGGYPTGLPDENFSELNLAKQLEALSYVEGGDDASGHWRKWNDGRLECWNITTNNYNVQTTIIFPVVFAVVPRRINVTADGGSSAYLEFGEYYNIKVGSMVVIVTSISSSGDYQGAGKGGTVSWSVEGKWK